MTRQVALAIVLASVIGAIGGCARDEAPPNRDESSDRRQNSTGTDASSADQSSPEYALRQFLNAMLSGDKEGISRTALPHERLDVLVSENQPPQGILAAMKQQMQAAPISRLSVGDTVTLPDGRKLTLDSSWVNENRQQLTMPGNPIPFILVRTDGQWKVDAAPIIAGRLAAKAAEKRRQK